MFRRRLLSLVVAIVASAAISASQAADRSPTADELRFFETKIRPVLAENCYKCHGEAKQEENLRLDSRAAVLAGGDQGPAIVPGRPEESLLIKAVNHSPDLSMPPKRQLPREQIADLTLWIKSGAPWPDDGKPAAAPATRQCRSRPRTGPIGRFSRSSGRRCRP